MSRQTLISHSPIMPLQNQEPASLPSAAILYHFNGVPVMVRPDFWPIPLLVTTVLAWAAGQRKPERAWLERWGLGLAAMPIALFAEIGHALAHTISASLAGAPMDEIFLSSGMPRTLYLNNDVPPETHIQRSLGGPIFSLVCATLSLLWWRSSPHGSLSRDFAAVSLFGHSVILFGSLTPLPMVDGGVMLKWKLVEAGQSPEQADQIVQKTNIGLGATLIGLATWPAVRRKRRRVSGLLAAAGTAAIAAGIGWLK